MVHETHCVVVTLYQYLPPKCVVQELYSPSSWLRHGKTWLADNRYIRNNVTKATKAQLLMENNRGCHNFFRTLGKLVLFSIYILPILASFAHSTALQPG